MIEIHYLLEIIQISFKVKTLNILASPGTGEIGEEEIQQQQQPTAWD